MNCQKRDTAISKEQAADLIRAEYGDNEVSSHYMDYYAWPQQFPTTAGPFKGRVAGQAFCTFTMEAWACYEYAVIFCNGEIVRITADWADPGSFGA